MLHTKAMKAAWSENGTKYKMLVYIKGVKESKIKHRASLQTS
jgi:hypothetical protein